MSQPPKDQSRFVGNLANDVPGRLPLRHEANTLSGPWRQGINVTFGVGAERAGLIANNWAARFIRLDPGFLRMHFPTYTNCSAACLFGGAGRTAWIARLENA
jgi:hypothetical protein